MKKSSGSRKKIRIAPFQLIDCVHRQLGDFSQRLCAVFGYASWGICHLGNVPVGECASLKMCHLENVPVGGFTSWRTLTYRIFRISG